MIPLIILLVFQKLKYLKQVNIKSKFKYIIFVN